MIFRTLLLTCLAAPAWTACPVGDDLSAGIRLLDDDGISETYRRSSPDLIELTVDYGDGYSDRIQLARGVYVLEVVELYEGQPEPGSTSTYAYPVAPEAMPVPAAGDVWRTRVVIDGAEPDKMTASWGDARQMTYGECSYTVIPGEIVFTGTDYRHVEGLHYLPELGLAYMSFFSSDDGDTMDEYVIVSITTAEQRK
jgi:hypothetical protein